MSDELRPEYQFDYTQAKPNRFAAKLKKGGCLVVLEPEVARRIPEVGGRERSIAGDCGNVAAQCRRPSGVESRSAGKCRCPSASTPG